MRRIALVIISTVFFFTANTSNLLALELTISGNADGSTNEVFVESNTNTTISQENNVDISNDIETTTDTGGNSASENSSDTTVDTGSIDESVEVTNEVNNNIAVIDNSNSRESKVQVSDNSAGTNNTVDIDLVENTTFVSSNEAKITNSIQSVSNTGNNTANKNSGSVKIETGDITTKILVNNINVNTNTNYLMKSSNSFIANISGNSAYSVNKIAVNFDDSLDVFNSNIAEINNFITLNSNTGGNTANKNTDDVSITTGNIILDIVINNDGINTNTFIDPIGGCCNPSEDPVDNEEPEDPSDPGDNNNESGGSDSGSGSDSTGGDVAGTIAAIGGTVGEVLGLSDTSSGNGVNYLASTFAFILMTIGVRLITKQESAKVLA